MLLFPYGQCSEGRSFCAESMGCIFDLSQAKYLIVRDNPRRADGFYIFHNKSFSNIDISPRDLARIERYPSGETDKLIAVTRDGYQYRLGPDLLGSVGSQYMSGISRAVFVKTPERRIMKKINLGKAISGRFNRRPHR